MPFLRRVTAGRGVPDDRLAEVAEHYYHFGGASPINAQNRALVDALSRELADRGIDRPVLLANRNSPPYVADVLAGLGDARVLVVITSLLQGYSSCRQYREDLGMGSVGLPVRIDKLPAYGAHPGVRSAMARLVADSVTAAAQADPDGRLHLICVAHSIPESADESSGRPDQGGRAYSAGVHALADAVTQAAAQASGRELSTDVAWCSRSGPPHQPWLEPDVGDRIRELAEAGVTSVVVAPVGFISDHMEVVFDLDTEAAQAAEAAGVRFHRAPTLGTDPEFVAALVDLALGRAALARDESDGAEALSGLPPADCPPDCCRGARAPRPARCATEEPANVR